MEIFNERKLTEVQDIATYNSVLRFFAQNQDLQMCKEIFNEMCQIWDEGGHSMIRANFLLSQVISSLFFVCVFVGIYWYLLVFFYTGSSNAQRSGVNVDTFAALEGN